MRQFFLASALVTVCAACASMPGRGPSAGTVESAAGRGDQTGYVLINLTYEAAQVVTSTPAPLLTSLQSASSVSPIDLIGIGDVLAITVFEAGSGGLFSSSRGQVIAASPETLPRVAVDRDGEISMPFAGEVKVAGLTPQQAGAGIEAALKGRAVDPQVVVSVVENHSNSVTVIGEVRAAGRYALNPQSDTLLDAIAQGGGATKPTGDIEVVVVRGAKSVSAPLEIVMSDFTQNIRLAPHDQIRLNYRPRSYSTFGAFATVAQTRIGDDDLTLASAISRSGGLDDAKANPSSVLLFRFERTEVARSFTASLPGTQLPRQTPKGVPVVYRLDLRDPASFFIANSFPIRHDDLIYVPNSDIAEVQKFFNFVQSATRVVYDISATTLIAQ